MSTTGLEVFDSTIQKTHIWLKEIMGELGCDRRAAYLALRAGLISLRDRLTPAEAAELGAQLPMMVRGIYYEGWHPTGKPVKVRTREEFLDMVREKFNAHHEIDPERIVRAVFKVLNRHITRGEVEDVRDSLPQRIQVMWPEPPQA